MLKKNNYTFRTHFKTNLTKEESSFMIMIIVPTYVIMTNDFLPQYFQLTKYLHFQFLKTQLEPDS